MRRLAALAVFVAILTTGYIAACMLPGGPSDAERIQFTLDSVTPHRVPLAGVVEPSITISANGQVLRNPRYRLETLDAGIVRVDATERRLLGVMRGTAGVRVTYLGATGTPDTVFPVQVVISRVVVDSPALAFNRLGGEPKRLSAVALNANNAAVANVLFTWSTADTTVAAVNDTGLVTAVDEGATTIIAEADGVVDTSAVTVTQGAAASVRVIPALDTLRAVVRPMQFNAVAFDSTGDVLIGAKARWSSSDSSVATVNATTGLATARHAGTVRIIARVGQARDSATLVVKQVPWFIRVRPPLDTLTAIDDTGRVSAIGTDSGGSDIPNLPVTWTTNDSTIASVDQTGLVRAKASGLVLVTASSGSQSAFATIVVKQEIVAVRVSPDSEALTGAGDTVRFRAVAVDRNHFAVNGAAFTWSSRDGFVATVDTGGLVTARGGGRTGVVATLAPGGRADTVSVSVTGAPPLGALLIRTMTTGSQPDPDGYAVLLDSSSTYHLGTSDTVALTTPAGAHTVELSEYAGNCILWASTRTVVVPVGDTARVDFAVSCAPADSLIVTTTTTGADLDPNGYYVCVDDEVWWESGCYATWAGSVGVNGTVAFYPVPTGGTYSIRLVDVDANCTVGQNPRSVTTSLGVTTHVTFSVSCVQTGSVRVTTATTGANLDPDGYGVSVSGTGVYPIGVNASHTFDRLPAGNYVVTLSSLAANCSISGPASQTVTVVAGVTADVAFAVTCAPLAAIRATVTTTGVEPDPDGYFVTANGASGSRSGAVAPNGAVVLDSLNQGTYTVTLSGVAGNCTVSGPGAVTVAATWGVTSDVAFAVTCVLPAAIRVTVATTGVDPDADGYVATAAGPRGYNSVAVATNGAVVIDRLIEGTYTVSLGGVAVDCAVTTSNPLVITVAMGDTADVAFAVACTTASQLAVVRGVNGNTDIYLVNTSGAVLSRLTSHGAYDINPAWSPDGSKIAFVSMRDGNDEIYVMSADGSGQTRLTFNGASDRSPTWSPDGGRIAFVSNGDVYVMNADGSNPVRLTSSGNNNDPDWSPDGSKIAFQGWRDGSSAIYLMNADGSGVMRFTVNPSAYDAQPDWAPDGAKLVFLRVTCDDPCWINLVVRSVNGSEVELPADGTDSGWSRNPAWSRDGSWIAFGVGSTVSAIRPDGTRQVAILGNASEPAWKP